MIALFVLFVLVGCVFWTATTPELLTRVMSIIEEARTRARASRVKSSVLRADAAVADEHRRARKAMNEASGQSWRNRFE